MFTDSYSGTLGVGGLAGAGGTVEFNSVTSTVQAYLGGENVSVNDINIPDTKIIPIYNTWLKHRNFCNKMVLSGTKHKIK